MTIFTQDKADKLMRDFQLFIDELHEFQQVHSAQGPTANSLATSESTSFADPEDVMTAYSQGLILLDVAEDQAEAFIRSVVDPALSFAVWTSVRVVLESSALAAWLFDTDIAVKIRVQRSLAFRYEGLEQHLKLLKSIGRQAEQDKLVKRIDSIESEAIALGFNKVIDRKGRRIGIGQVMPSVTEIIRDILNEEKAYRILSAVAHGHFWALQQLGMQTVIDQSTTSWDSIQADTKALQKHLRPEGVGYLCVMTASVFTKALWRASNLFDWDRVRLKEILESNFDRIGFSMAIRHWRSSRTSATTDRCVDRLTCRAVVTVRHEYDSCKNS